MKKLTVGKIKRIRRVEQHERIQKLRDEVAARVGTVHVDPGIQPDAEEKLLRDILVVDKQMRDWSEEFDIPFWKVAELFQRIKEKLS